MSAVKAHLVREQIEAMEVCMFNMRELLDTEGTHIMEGAIFQQEMSAIAERMEEIRWLTYPEMRPVACGLCEHYEHMLTLKEHEQEDVPSYYIYDAVKWVQNDKFCENDLCCNYKERYA
jgi:hypothetical protein